MCKPVITKKMRVVYEWKDEAGHVVLRKKGKWEPAPTRILVDCCEKCDPGQGCSAWPTS